MEEHVAIEVYAPARRAAYIYIYIYIYKEIERQSGASAKVYI